MSQAKENKAVAAETTVSKTEDLCIDFHGAAIIDEQGNEIPITEEMVKQACQAIDQEKTND